MAKLLKIMQIYFKDIVALILGKISLKIRPLSGEISETNSEQKIELNKWLENQETIIEDFKKTDNKYRFEQLNI